ncbi:coiled-coil domain-containing protein 149-like [Brevipalpus obovatus]|uniref:coiled-coil domain-containing protein 149-like n=1 Tax=Brevipalpus obovatus TaxID=246614 RepID=UPI003D9DB9A1
MMTQTMDQNSNPISAITGEVNQSKQLQEALNEISTLRCKLDSKARALVILSQDLLECKRERDEYKLVSDQVKEKYSSLKKRIDSFGSGLVSLSNSHGGNEFIDGPGGPNNLTSTSFAQILCQLKDQNKSLLYELEDHKTKLIDCEGDIRMLRGQLSMMKRRPISEINSYSSYNMMTSTNFHGSGQGRQGRTDNNLSSSSCSASLPSEDKHSLVTQLELIKNRNSMLERDVQSLLDEKEELIVSRDAYKAKVERLNERLNNLLVDSSNCDEQTAEKIRENFKTLDIEGLLDEKNFLRGKITTLEEEKIRLKNIIDKYRKILEKNNSSNNNFLLDSNFSDESSHRSSHHNQRSGSSSISSSNVISSKQVQHFIATNLSNLTLSQSSLAHLKSLVIALYEALTDKSAALALQRKNNRLLGERLEELEEKVRQLKAREKVFFLMRDDHHVKSEIVSDFPHTSADLEDLSDGDMNPKIDEQSSGNHPSPALSKNDTGEVKLRAEDQRSEEEDDNDDEEIQLPSNLEALIEEESAKIAREHDQSGTIGELNS